MRADTILVVDNDAQEYKMICEGLEDRFQLRNMHELDAVNEAFQRGEAKIVCVVFTDSFLEKTGWENPVIASVEDRYGAAVVAILDRQNMYMEETVLKAGISHIIFRPYNAAILAKRLENAIIYNEVERTIEYDVLTGLYNKDFFYRKVRERLDRHPNVPYGIICLDIERFKVVNDIFGASEGDALLQYVAKQLIRMTKSYNGIAGRLVSDVFALCLTNIESEQEVIADYLIDKLKKYSLSMEIIPAIGFYYVDDITLPVERMCDRAILALNGVKGNYLRHVAAYNNELRERLIMEQEILNDMEHGLENHEFQVFFQPKCEMRNGRIAGSEALVRWLHPNKGMIPPNEFIPVFERNGFILKLDAYVWEEVCKFLKSCIDTGKKVLPVSVNVSRINVFNKRLCKLLISLVEKYGLEPELLELEITESAYTNNLEELLEVVNELRKYGFTILMDDFGSGYSSLNMLKDITVDILKIDLKFLKSTKSSEERGSNIIESIVRMAKWLNLSVIAEGVETKKQAEFLMSIGCSYAQGYYYYRPMERRAFLDLLEQEEVSQGMLNEAEGNILIDEFLQTDIISSTLLNNIIGGVGIYEYRRGELFLLRANEAYYKMMGDSREDTARSGQRIIERVFRDDHMVFKKEVEEARKKRTEGTEMVLRYFHMDGTLMWLRVRLFFMGENGEKALYCASIQDITETRNIQEKLELVIKNTPGDIVVFKVKKQNVTAEYISDGLTRIKGNIRRKNFFCRVYAQDRKMIEARLLKMASKRENINIDFRCEYQGGVIGWTKLNAEYQGEENGSAVYYGIFTDITAIKNTEESKRLSEQMLRFSMFQLGILVWEYDFATRSIILQPEMTQGIASLKIFPDIPESLLQSGEIHPDSAKDYAKMYTDMSCGEQHVSCEVQVRHKNGTYHWYAMRYSVLYNTGGNLVKAVGTAQNIDAKRL